MTIKASRVVLIYLALGYKACATWPASRLETALATLHKAHGDVAPEDLQTDDEKTRKAFAAMVKASKDGTEIKVEEDREDMEAASAPADEDTKPAAKKEKGGKSKSKPAKEEPEGDAEEGDEEEEDAGEETKEEKPAKSSSKKKKGKPAQTTSVPGGSAVKKTKPEKKGAKKAAAKPEKKAAKKSKPAAEKKAREPGKGVREEASRPYICGVVIKKHGLAAGITDAMVKEVDKAYGAANERESRFALRNSWHAIRGWMGAKNPSKEE